MCITADRRATWNYIVIGDTSIVNKCVWHTKYESRMREIFFNICTYKTEVSTDNNFLFAWSNLLGNCFNDVYLFIEGKANNSKIVILLQSELIIKSVVNHLISFSHLLTSDFVSCLRYTYM